MKKRNIQKFILLSLFLWMAFNIPLVLLFNTAEAIFGIPIIYFYIFSVWILSIIITFILVKNHHE